MLKMYKIQLIPNMSNLLWRLTVKIKQCYSLVVDNLLVFNVRPLGVHRDQRPLKTDRPMIIHQDYQSFHF